MDVCTIIAKQEVAAARVLARSLAEHAPGARLRVLLLDPDAERLDPAGEPFEVLLPDSIPEFARLAASYERDELRERLRPQLAGTYVEPAARVYGPLDSLDAVGHWNLTPGAVSRENGAYRVDGEPLRLFVFRGFDPARPHLLSSEQDELRLGEEPALARLCRDYAQELVEAGHERAAHWPYAWSTTHGRHLMTESLRAAYRTAVAAGELAGAPFDPAGEAELFEWCNRPAARGGEHGVTRYLEILHGSRPDLAATYADLGAPGDARGFLGWAAGHGAAEVPIPRALLPAPAPAEPGDPAAPLPPLGVNVAGYVRSELGIGEVARQIIGALDAHGVPLLPVGLHAPNSRSGHAFAAQEVIAAPFDVNIVCVNADGLPAFAREAGPGFFEGRHTIGVWWWELSEFPAEWDESFSHLDELWVGSRFVAEALAEVSPIPVVTLPLPLAAPPDVDPDPGALGLPDGFVFLFAFDYNSVFRRKNPLAVLDAFTRAFAPGDGAQLVLKSINHERDPDAHDRLVLAAAEHPHVHLMPGYLEAADNARLVAACDAYVSLHRSEGFGIGMAEAMLRGKPVIATGYGGNTEFLDETTGFPVRFDLVPVGEGAWPYPATSTWAEPDVEHAAELLRRVFDDPGAARERAARGRERLLERHSPHAAGERMLRRLESIHDRRTRERLEPPPPRPAPSVDLAAGRLDRGPVPPPSSTGGAAGRRLRDLVLRLIKPYSVHAELVQRDLVAELRDQRAELERLQRDLEELRIATALSEAQTQAELRRQAP